MNIVEECINRDGMYIGGRVFDVAVSPYALQYGKIVVPNVLKQHDEIERYIEEHFDDIQFSEPKLDYRGVDFEFYDDNGERW